MTTQRLAAPDPDTYSPRQREIHDTIAGGPRGGVRGPLAIWLHRPELAARAQELGRYCRYDTSLDPRLSELCILITARIFNSEYEWAAHKPPALETGLSAEIVEAIRAGEAPELDDPELQVVHDVTCAAHRERHLDGALYARAVEVLGEERLVDLVGVIGYYTLISLTINVFRVSPPAHVTPELTDV